MIRAAGGVMAPVLEGELMNGKQLPMTVELLDEDDE